MHIGTVDIPGKLYLAPWRFVRSAGSWAPT